METISVILCAHNPRPKFLERTLGALGAQTIAQERWELLLIDNASTEPLVSRANLSWHPAARHVTESELGLTPARLRGIQEARGELLVFVDDDNFLQPDYLHHVACIEKEWPQLGAWGGQVDPEFEISPPDWTKSYWHLLALKSVPQDRWANFPSAEAFPVGAGMCVRKVVATHYRNQTSNNPRRRLMDRRGSNLESGGDMDIFLTACEMGFGTGVFSRLKLTHLIPSGRLQEEYLLRLVEGVAYSTRMMDYSRNDGRRRGVENLLKRRLRRVKDGLAELLMDSRERRFHRATLRGWARADADVQTT